MCVSESVLVFAKYLSKFSSVLGLKVGFKVGVHCESGCAS